MILLMMSNDIANEGDIVSDYLEAVSFNFSVSNSVEDKPCFLLFFFLFPA